AAISRCGSRGAASDMTTNVTCPGSRRLAPSLRVRILQLGGKMLDTLTRLHAAIPADRSASSKDVSFSRCLPTPLVKNISFGTNPTTLRSLSARGNLHGKHQVFECQENRGPRAGRHDRLGSLTISHHNEFAA